MTEAREGFQPKRHGKPKPPENQLVLGRDFEVRKPPRTGSSLPSENEGIIGNRWAEREPTHNDLLREAIAERERAKLRGRPTGPSARDRRRGR